MARTWRILSIDGGGIRGLIPAVLLEQIEYSTSKRIADLFDFVTGTSTGAIIALGLVVPSSGDGKPTVPRYRADDIIELYLSDGPKIFRKSLWQGVDEWAFGGAKYNARAIEQALNTYFGATKLGDALTNVMVPTYCLEKRLPIFFKSWNSKQDAGYLMGDLARASSASPTYFIPEKLQTPEGINGFIDGGLVSNNPTMTALVECKRYAQPGDHFLVVSLGTGRYERTFEYAQAIHWRPIDWIQPIIDICMDGSDAKTDYEMRQLSRAPELTYYRFDCLLPAQLGDLDDASIDNMNKLKAAGASIYEVEMASQFANMLGELNGLRNQSKIQITWSELPPALQPFAAKESWNAGQQMTNKKTEANS